MARVELPVTVLNPTTGLPVNGASVAITQRATAAAVTWWTAETGGTSSTAAVVTDANGRATAWTARGAYNLTISGPGITTYVEPWDAIPSADGGADTAYFPDNVVTSAKVSALDAAKITTGTLPAARYGTGTIPGSALVDGAVTIAKMAVGNGSRILLVRTLFGYTLAAGGTVDIIPGGEIVTHNNKAGVAIYLHSFRATGTSTASFKLIRGGVAQATWNYAMVSGDFGMVGQVYAYTALTGAQTWGSTVSQVGGATVEGDGQGILLIVEQN